MIVLKYVNSLSGDHLFVCLCLPCCSVGQLGSHLIYRIESTQMVYLPHQTVRVAHPDETKYVMLFHTMHLGP